MRTSHHHEPRDPDALRDMGYEPDGVSIGGVRAVAIAFTSLVVATMIGVGLWYWLAGPGSHPPPGVDARRTLPQNVNPNNPVLQNSVTSKTDIMTLRREETEALEGTGYVDESKGIVHIPIERAIDVIASGRYISSGMKVPALSPAARAEAVQRAGGGPTVGANP